MPKYPRVRRTTTEPTLRLVVAEKRPKWQGDVYEAHIRMSEGKTFRWTEKIYAHIGWPQEQAAQPTTYYHIPGYGDVRYKGEAFNYLLERMETNPEEFERMYVRR